MHEIHFIGKEYVTEKSKDFFENIPSYCWELEMFYMKVIKRIFIFIKSLLSLLLS